MKISREMITRLVFIVSIIGLSSYTTWCIVKSSNSGQQAKKEPLIIQSPTQWDSIVKNPEILNESMEGTPFVWENSLYYFVSNRNNIDTPFMQIYDFLQHKKIVSFAQSQGLALGSAFVDGDTFYAFGTKDHGLYGKSQIYLIKSKDLQTFSEPLLIYQAPENQGIFNTSVTKNIEVGDYIMVIETSTEGELAPFTLYFLNSKDLIHWSLVPDAVFGKDIYVACPTIKYIDRYYYLWFLMREFNDPNCTTCVTYVTKIARSKNLLTWETSPHYFMTPDRLDEGINTSDVDLTEFDNKVYILYAVGDQNSWANMKYAVYNGSLSHLVNDFFSKTSSESSNIK